MLKFQGNLSNDCKAYALKRQRKISSIIIFFIGLILSIPFLILTFVYNWIFIMAVILLLMMPLFQFFSFKGSTLDLILPIKIVIDDSTIQSEGTKFLETRKLSQITKIIDYGEWYHIFFKFPYRSQNFIVEKKLLIEGSLEDFNNLFKEKIYKKY